MAARAPGSGLQPVGVCLKVFANGITMQRDSTNLVGLMRDDTMYEDDDVKEALKRLPEDMYNERLFRLKRALDLSMRQQILPKEQWVKYEEDKFYLEPYLKEVIRERLEREEWEKK
ncbi:hypothetical protein lerEdw1_008675 [Lerista edwardsae]|nr:hypothetical protein lerEdw1_008675 [Lerista edwardsae]